MTQYLQHPITPLLDTIRAAVVDALAKCDGNQRDAARLLDISPRTLSYQMDKLGIERPTRMLARRAREETR